MTKNFMIFGDSYSTHKEFIPNGYAYYYCTEGWSEDEPVTKMLPEQTWWGQYIAKTNANLVLNDSWSGSTIGYTGYSGDCSSTSSFIYRYIKLFESGFFSENEIDTIFVFGGTNDSWANAPLGTEQYSNWVKEDLFNVLPAVCYFMSRLRQDNPNTKLVFIGNCDIKQEIIDCMKNASERLDAEFVELSNIDKQQGHPTVLGMAQICEQLIERLTD